MPIVIKPLTDAAIEERVRRLFLEVDANRPGSSYETSAIGIDPVEERVYFGPGIQKLLAACPDADVRKRMRIVCIGMEDCLPGGRIKWRRVMPGHCSGQP